MCYLVLLNSKLSLLQFYIFIWLFYRWTETELYCINSERELQKNQIALEDTMQQCHLGIVATLFSEDKFANELQQESRRSDCFIKAYLPFLSKRVATNQFLLKILSYFLLPLDQFLYQTLFLMLITTILG